MQILQISIFFFSPIPQAASPASTSGGQGGGPSTLSLQHIGVGGNAIAAAASQAIAATQQLSGRRSSSLKASYEAINLGVQANEFSIGRELAGAAQAAIASTSFETQVRGHLRPYNNTGCLNMLCPTSNQHCFRLR